MSTSLIDSVDYEAVDHDDKEKEVSIVGAGLVGVLVALRLAHRGYNVKLFEQRTDFRHQNSEREFMDASTTRLDVNTLHFYSYIWSHNYNVKCIWNHQEYDQTFN